MATEETTEQRNDADTSETGGDGATEKPEVTDEHKQQAKEMAEAYKEENLQTTTLPGSNGTVSGTSVTDWVDDEDKGKIETSAEEGNVEYRNTDEFKEKLDEA